MPKQGGPLGGPSTPAHQRAAFTISYTATGGAFGGTAATANTPLIPGVELDTTEANDTIYVASTPAQSNVTINAEGTTFGAGPNSPGNQVFVGFDGGNTNDPESASTLNGILSPVTVVGQASTNLVVADEAAPGPESYGVYAGELTSRAAPIFFNQSSNVNDQLTDLTLFAGPNGNRIHVGSTNEATTTTVNAGPGTNMIQVYNDAPPSFTGVLNLDAIAGPLVVTGGGGTNTLEIDDSASAYPETYTLGVATNAMGQITGGTFSRAAESVQIVPNVFIAQIPVSISYSAIARLMFGSSGAETLGFDGPTGNTINVTGTVAGTTTVINADGVITNQVTVTNLSQIQGGLTLAGSAPGLLS